MRRSHPRPRVEVLELGGEHDAFAAREAASAATDVTVVAPGLAIARGVERDRVRTLAYTHRASRLVGRTAATVADAAACLDAAALDVAGTVAVRARDVRRTAGIDTQTVERRLGSVLADRGFAVDLDDPDHELRVLFADEACVLGWLAAGSRRDFGSRAPTEKPFFKPGSMEPLLARALVNIAGARPGSVVVDPMCGTGGVLVEAGLVGACVVGLDAQATMARGAARNLDHYLGDGTGAGSATAQAAPRFATARADATRLPLCDGAADAAVFDAPYGRQSRIEGDLDVVVAGALAEAQRVTDRAVMVGDRPWTTAAREAGWTVQTTFERRVHRSLVRHIAVLD